jgi:hypothetical protein
MINHLMLALRHLVIFLVLAGPDQTALADEASDAVRTLSTLWKGKSATGSASQFVGDRQTFRMRLVGQTEEGVVYVETSEAPFRFLTIPEFPLSSIYEGCFTAGTCVLVRCLFKRECIFMTEIEHDPVYKDARREATHTFQRAEEGGFVNPADAQRVREALRTLIGLNAAPPFDPQDPHWGAAKER